MPSKLFKWGPTDHHWFSSFVIVEYETLLFFQVLPIRWVVSTPAIPLGCQTVPVSSVRKEVRPQWPSVQTHQSPPFSANQPDSSLGKLRPGLDHWKSMGIMSLLSYRHAMVARCGYEYTGAEQMSMPTSNQSGLRVEAHLVDYSNLL